MLQDRLGLSERRACRITGQHRSTQRHQALIWSQKTQALRKQLLEISPPNVPAGVTAAPTPIF